MRMLWISVPAAAAALVAAACNGSVVTESTGSGDGGEGGAATATETTIASGGAAGGDTATTCVVQPEDPNGGFVQPTCDDLAAMVVAAPALTTASGNGKVAPGETATLTVHLEEITGKGFFSYPGVKFGSDIEGVSVSNEAMLYGIMPCQDVEMSTLITVGAGVPHGATLHVTAQVEMLGMDCPDAFQISVPVPIQ